MNLAPLSPLFALVVGGLVPLLIEVVRPGTRRLPIAAGAVGLLTAFAILLKLLGNPPGPMQTDSPLASGILVTDALSIGFSLVLVAAGLLALALLPAHLDRQGGGAAEATGLLMASLAGGLLMASTRNLLVLFVAFELLSLPLYVLVAFHRDRVASVEAGMKYLLLGAFATGLLLLGIAFLYGASGSLDLRTLAEVALRRRELLAADVLWTAGAFLVLAGLAFELALVPFHGWAPDAYQAGPTPVVAFMSVAAKAASAAAILRVFSGALEPLHPDWGWGLAWIAAATIVAGNLMALPQTNLKRMLGYSSISHAGYLTLGLLVPLPEMRGSLLFYLAVYLFMNVGAFAFVQALETKEAGVSREDCAGLASRRPLLALGGAVAMASLTGIPPFGGFMGKLYLFAGGVEAGYVPLVVVALLGSVVSAYYYLGIVVEMYFRPAPAGEAPRASFATASVLALASAATLWVGLWPGPLLSLARRLTLVLL